MAFDFPASPTTGQLFTPAGGGGVSYVWNGYAWDLPGVGSGYAPIASPVFTGDPQAPTGAATDNDTSIATTAFVQRAAVGVAGVRGLTGSGVNTTITFSANEIALRNSNGNIVRVSNVSSVSVNMAAAVGAGGPDATLSDGDVHLYAIWNGSAVAGIISMTAPPTGPTLPSGYTHWCYLTTAKRASAAFVSTGFYIRGEKVHYLGEQVILSGGNPGGTWTSVSSAARVPANALSVIGFFTCGATTSGAGSAGIYYYIAPTNSGAHYNIRLDLSGPSWNLFQSCAFDMPNLSQTIWYNYAVQYGAANFAASNIDIYVNGYTVPNGS